MELGSFDALEYADSAESMARLRIRGGYPISWLAGLRELAVVLAELA